MTDAEKQILRVQLVARVCQDFLVEVLADNNADNPDAPRMGYVLILTPATMGPGPTTTVATAVASNAPRTLVRIALRSLLEELDQTSQTDLNQDPRST